MGDGVEPGRRWAYDSGMAAKQVGRLLRLGYVRFAWVILALLAAFVIFIECMADVGGDADPILEPTPTQVTE